VQPALAAAVSGDAQRVAVLKQMLSKVRKFLSRVREFLGKPTDVHYTSVPLWRPWRDF